MNKKTSTRSTNSEAITTSASNTIPLSSTGSAHALPVSFEGKSADLEWNLPIPKNYAYALIGAIAEGHYTEF